MGKAYTCDVCNIYFSADPTYNAHTTLSDNVEGHESLDICPECTKGLLSWLEERREHIANPTLSDSE